MCPTPVPEAPPAGGDPLPEGTARLGLALSGGGSRAAAFHRGTVRGLAAAGLLDGVEVVSSVSGGSLFAGAWMAARARGEQDATFLERMAAELRRGFLLRSVRPAALKLLLPRYGRTDLLAETFDRIFFRGARLASLPARPRLCINVSVLNHAEVGKFSREGFTTWQVTPARAAPGTRPTVPLPELRLSRAVAASAAFPIGLPPVRLSRVQDLGGATFSGALAGLEELSLSDGGVLENLGVQTLLAGRFRAWDLVLSDAGTREAAWRQRPLVGPLRAAAVALLGGGALDRVLSVMNGKQNRWTRQETMNALEESWAAAELRRAGGGAGVAPAMREWLAARPAARRRRVLFVRVDQTLEHLLAALAGREARWRLVELWRRAHPGQPLPAWPSDAAEVEAFVARCGVDLGPARRVYEALGGSARAGALNRVATQFTALSAADVDALALHAEWQVLATHALYW